MIYGIGCDLCKVDRFYKWIEKPEMLNRFFNPKEMLTDSALQKRQAEHYAVRFAAKEAFGKAMKTGLDGFGLKDVFVVKDKSGAPYIQLEGDALDFFNKKYGNHAVIHLSLSHEGQYAMAYVIIEGEDAFDNK